MTVNSIPNAGQPIAGGMRVDPTWYKWLRELDREARDTGADLSAEIQAIARKLGSPDGTIDGIPESSQSLTALPPLTISGNQITLSTLTADTAGELFGISRDAYGRISALRPVVAGAGITIDGTTDPDEIAIVNSGLVNPMTTAGDLIRGGTAGAPERIPVGTNTQVLTVVSGVPAWAAAPGGLSNPMTTAEDLIKGGASGVPTRLAVGTNGQVLTVTGGAVGWATPAAGGAAFPSGWVGFVASTVNTSSVNPVGISAPTLTGTALSQTVSGTSSFTSQVRRGISSNTGISGLRGADGSFLMLGGSTGVGGFKVYLKGGVGTGGAIGAHRFFMGLWASTAAPTDVNPSTLVNMIGLGYDSADTQVQIMHNDGSGAATKIALGAGFPKPTAADVNFYTLRLTTVPGSGVVNYEVSEISTGNTASGSISTNLPAATTTLNFYKILTSGGTAVTVICHSSLVHIEV